MAILLENLSPRETEICDALVAGQKPAAIARDLGISIATVRKHITSIFRKREVNSQLELVMLELKLRGVESHSNGSSPLPAPDPVEDEPQVTEYLLLSRTELEEVVRNVARKCFQQITADFQTELAGFIKTSVAEALANEAELVSIS